MKVLDTVLKKIQGKYPTVQAGIRKDSHLITSSIVEYWGKLKVFVSKTGA